MSAVNDPLSADYLEHRKTRDPTNTWKARKRVLGQVGNARHRNPRRHRSLVRLPPRPCPVSSEGTARQYHLSPANPHLFCGCGAEASDCHPGRCCRDDEWGQCTEHGKPAPPDPDPDEAELSDPLFDVTDPLT